MFPRSLSNYLADWFDLVRGQKGIKHEIVSFYHVTANNQNGWFLCAGNYFVLLPYFVLEKVELPLEGDYQTDQGNNFCLYRERGGVVA